MIDTNGMTIEEAIVAQACEDYRLAIRGRCRNPERMLGDCKRFFKSKWYRALTDADAEYLIELLDKEWEDGQSLIKAGNEVEVAELRKDYFYTCPLCGGRARVRESKRRGSYMRTYQCEKCKTTETYVPSPKARDREDVT